VIRIFRASCFAFVLAVLFPLVVQAIRQATILSHPGASAESVAFSLKFFQASFMVLAVGAPAAYVVMLFSGVQISRSTVTALPLLRAGLALVLSPLLLKALVFGVDKFIPGYSRGPQGMGLLVGFLTPILVGGGILACIAAVGVFLMGRARDGRDRGAA